jgi:hypothetical protein
LADFVLRIPAKFTLGALPEPLFGQFQRMNSATLQLVWSTINL